MVAAPIIKPFAIVTSRVDTRFEVVEIKKEMAKSHERLEKRWNGTWCSRVTRVMKPVAECYSARFDTEAEAEAAAARGNRKWDAHKPFVRDAHVAMIKAQDRAAIEAKAALTAEADECPVCILDFQPEDICAIDVDLGICHAACLADAPVVDLDTGAELPESAKVLTFRYADSAQPREEA